MPTDVRIFSGRMNDDDHGTVVPATDYRYAKNVHIMHSADGGVASIKNVPGTTEVPFSLHGTVGVKVVGSIEDEENNRVFYFVKATTGHDEILCYNKTTNEVKSVYKDSILVSVDGQGTSLGLSDSYLITGIAFVYPWLFWTDDNGAPRRIDVERGLRTFDVTYLSPDATAPEPYTIPIDYKDLAIAHEVPKFPIETRKLVSADEADVDDQPTNQIGLYAFQFSYRFLYKDGTLSVLAPYSKVVNYNSDTIPDEYDTIEVAIPKSQLIPNEVDEVQILVRDPQTNNWGIIKRYRRETDETLIDNHNQIANPDSLLFYFFNNYASTGIPEAEAIKLFDSIPIKSKSMEVAQNRLFLGNNLEGYDPIDEIGIMVDLSQSESLGLPADQVTYILVYPDTFNCNSAYYAVIVIRVETGDPAVDGYYFVSYTNTVNWANGTLPTEFYIPPSNKIGSLNDFIPETALLSYYAFLWGCPSPGPNSYIDTNYIGPEPKVYGIGNDGVLDEGDLIYKSGSRYQVGIVFYDYAGRNAGVYTNDDCLVYTPERLFGGDGLVNGITWLIDGTLNNAKIPDWATHYSIVRTKNLTTSFFAQQFVQFYGYVLKDEETGEYTYQDTYPGDDKVYAVAWDISWFSRANLGYVFSQGDILKIIPRLGTSSDKPSYNSIIGQEGGLLFTSISDSALIYNSGLGEIYTPIREDEQPLFYEVGEVYAIANPGTASKEFTVYSGILRGDCVFKARPFDDPTPTPLSLVETENMSPNDNVWQVWNTDAGRPNVVLYDSKQERRKTAIRWSNQYVAGAKINGLCSFDEVDEVVLEEASGPIQKLLTVGKGQSEGSVMLSVGTNNTYSMYLGETQLVDNSEQTLLATSGRVVGTIRDLRGGYGTNHPESVVENEGRAYWYDEQRGVVVRYAANGLTPISDYKFRAFFNRLSGQTRGTPIIGGFDKLRTEYLLCAATLNTDSDVEWLNDYLGDRISTGRLTYGGPISLAIPLSAGITYTFTVNWSGAGTFQVYVDADLVATQVYGGDETYDITFTPDADGFLGYAFTPDDSPPRGSYVLAGALISPHQAWRGEGFTLGFRDIDGLEGWTSFYSFIPEWFSKSGNLLLSFKNGKLYRHDNETTYNRFYGTSYASGIAFVVNQPAAIVKWAGSIGVQANDTPTWIHIRTENPYIQSSDLEDEDMRLREGIYYGEIRRDRLSPNATGTYFEKSLKGDKMRSSLLEVYVEFSTFAEELNVYLIKFMWQQSKGHY